MGKMELYLAKSDILTAMGFYRAEEVLGHPLEIQHTLVPLCGRLRNTMRRIEEGSITLEQVDEIKGGDSFVGLNITREEIEKVLPWLEAKIAVEGGR